MNVHFFCPECFLKLSQSVFPLNQPGFTKCRQTTLFLVENTLISVIHIKARLLVDAMGYIRKNCNEYLHRLFKMISFIATENEITVTKPRSPGRQRHTANAATNTIEEHIRISLLPPIVTYMFMKKWYTIKFLGISTALLQNYSVRHLPIAKTFMWSVLC
jgi:hypothetical protein